MKRNAFCGTEKDYSTYIGVLKAAGLRPDQVLFDYGCSWGYGSWQLRQAGFCVYSYEISRPRALYAAQHLGCDIRIPAELPGKVDCMFSAHVIEHLVNPKLLWDVAQGALKPNGIMVLFTPNGEPSRALTDENYHRHWGQSHPLLLTADALRIMAGCYGYITQAYSSPYDLSRIGSGEPGSLDGGELLLIARRG
jgi:2-polyprenyl-3-methyl-5-hydroxy-6-metoxy-1,4-benzoquinol methylase